MLSSSSAASASMASTPVMTSSMTPFGRWMRQGVALWLDCVGENADAPSIGAGFTMTR